MADFLATMAAASRERCEAAVRREPESALRERAMFTTDPVPPVLPRHRFFLIAEIKRSSPSAGNLGPAGDAEQFVASQARAYAAGGAAIISVLTEPLRFGGDLRHVAVASRTVRTPVMRKDFLVDPYQVVEARLAGAAGVLLIVRMLDEPALASMLRAARDMMLFVLLEAFDERDLARISALLHEGIGSPMPRLLCGVNTRDLATLAVDPGRLSRLAPLMPRMLPRIAESGIATPDDVRAAVRLGYTGVLVGTALVLSGNPLQLCREMAAAGSAAAGEVWPPDEEAFP